MTQHRQKDYRPVYKFFSDHPTLVDFLSEEMLVSLLRDNFPGQSLASAFADGERLPLGKGIYMTSRRAV